MNLKSLMVDSKSAWVDYPGLPGFEIEVVNLSKKELTKLRKRCTTQKFARGTAGPIETLDEEQFVTEFSKATIKNWKGLKLKYLEDLILVDLGDQDTEKELPFSLEDAEQLVSNSTNFDEFINSVVFDLERFRGVGNRGNVEEA